MKFEDYLMYCDASTDDMPLYLFDKDFVKKAPHLAHDFEVVHHHTDNPSCSPVLD